MSEREGALSRFDPRSFGIAFLFLIIGLIWSFHPAIFSSFRQLQTDIGDTRFVIYLLEHGYRWVTGEVSSFWDAPFFYPVKNVLAYSEILLSVGPFYWIWRLFGLDMDSSFQAWQMTVSALNFVSFWFFLGSVFVLNPIAKGIGAFLFAFGSSRITNLGHPQLVPQFYTVLSLIGMAQIFKPGDFATQRIKGYFLFYLGFVAQLYAAFYLGWFLALSLAIAAVWTLLLRSYRARIFEILRNDLLWIVGLALVSLAALWPMAQHYLEAARQVGMRGFVEISGHLVNPQAWFYLGPESWLYSWQTNARVFQIFSMEHEKRLGIGFITTAMVLVSFFRMKRNPAIRLLFLVGISWVVLISILPWWGYFNLWKHLYLYIPGASAIRAISRAGMMLLIPAGVALPFYFQDLFHQKKWVLACWLALVCVLEQGKTTYSHDKHEYQKQIHGISERVLEARRKAGCDAFFYSVTEPRLPGWRYLLDALYVQLETRIPTVNGYSGNIPPGYLMTSAIRDPQEQAAVASGLEIWAKTNGLDRSKICWVNQPDESSI